MIVHIYMIAYVYYMIVCIYTVYSIVSSALEMLIRDRILISTFFPSYEQKGFLFFIWFQE